MIESASQPVTSESACAGAITLSLADTHIRLLPHRAAYWPATNTLIIADLHLGKEEVGRTQGLPLPQSLVDEPLHRLAAAISLSKATRVLIVGDLLHNRAGLTTPFIEHIASWRASIPATFAVIPGNHDRAVLAVADAWQLTILPPTVREGPFVFTHIPPGEPGCDDSPESHELLRDAHFIWSGHIHPAVALPGRIRTKLPCFAISPRLGILPAFTPFASGQGMRFDDARLFAIADNAVIEVPAPRNSVRVPIQP